MRTITGILVWLGVVLIGAGCGRAVGDDFDGGQVDAAASPVVGAPQWSMFSATSRRNGRSAFEGPRLGVHRGVSLIGAGADAADVLVEAIGPQGDLYVLVRRVGAVGHLLALQPDGEDLWQYPEGEAMAVKGTALDGEGVLYLSGLQRVPGADSADASLNLFFQLSVVGQVQWAWHPPEHYELTTESLYNAPLYDDNGVGYAVHAIMQDPDPELRERRLHAYSADGVLLWQWERDIGAAEIPPALGPDGNVHVVVAPGSVGETSDEGLYVLDPQGDEVRFTKISELRFHTLTVGDDGTSYVAGYKDHVATVLAIGPAGDEAWIWHSDDEELIQVVSTIAIAADGTLYIGASKNNEINGAGGALLALSPEGGLLWSVGTTGTPCGGLAVDSTGALYALTSDPLGDSELLGIEANGLPRLTVVNYGDSRRCRPNLISIHTSSVVLADGGRIYFGSEDGTLHIVE